jgi:outer membrane protein assembly factor BamB
MKKKLLVPFLGLVAAAVLLTGCASGLSASSWPGITIESKVAYIAGGPYVYAVNLQTGAELWRFPSSASTANPFDAAPTLTADGQLIVGGFDHKLYSLNPANKAQNWTFSGAHDKYIGSPLASGNMIYAPNADYNLYALDTTGQLKWTFSADQSIWSQPATDGTRIFFGTDGHQVYALDAASGKLDWKYTVDDAVLGSPVLDGSLLIVGTYGGSLYALDPATGSLRWKVQVADRIWGGPAVSDGMIYFGDGSGNFYAYSTTGQLVWKQVLSGGVIGSPAVLQNKVAVGTDSGTLYFITLDGKTVSPVSVGGKIYSSLASNGSLVLVSSTGASALLTALDANGTQKWSYTPTK